MAVNAQLSFAGVPLLLKDPEGLVDRHLRTYLDERVASIFTANRVDYTEQRTDGRTNSAKEQLQHVPLPRPNFPLQPKPKLNTLYWPTGATRWSQGLFLIDGKNLQRILDAMAGSGSGGGANARNIAQSFVMKTVSTTTGINTQLYLLPPRPVSPPGIDSDKRLWILPLVDVRYFWQMMPVPFPLTAPSSWDYLMSAIAQAMVPAGIEYTSIPSSYGTPDPVEWTREYESAAMLLDAVAASVQMRIVRDWSPRVFTRTPVDVRMVNAATSATDMAANVAIQPIIIAGGDFSGIANAGLTPGYCITTFRNTENTKLAGIVYTANAPTASCDTTQAKVFHCAANVDVSGGSLPSAAQALGQQLATDYFSWLGTRYDYDLAGIVNWRPCGFDDFILWEYGADKRGRAVIAQTRVQSMPYNFGSMNVPAQLSSNTSQSSSGSLLNPSSSSSQQSSSSSKASSSSGSASTSGNCGCVTVVTSASCTSGGALSVTYGQARGCC